MLLGLYRTKALPRMPSAERVYILQMRVARDNELGERWSRSRVHASLSLCMLARLLGLHDLKGSTHDR
jgi:hypothetical protein